MGVAYGTDAKLVLKLLVDAANRDDNVLTQPPPVAYFIGFGDSSLNFELQFWVMQESNWVAVKSDVSVAIMKSFADAGIEIPFPQRDLHLRSVASSADLLALQGADAPGNGFESPLHQHEPRSTGKLAPGERE